MISARWRRTVLAFLAGIVLPTAAGCGMRAPAPVPSAPESAPPALALPPRPTELRLDGTNPCQLLKPAQTGQLGVNSGAESQDEDALRSPVCLWSNHAKPDNRWVARLYLGQSADFALTSSTGHEIVQVDGFPAVQTSAGFEDPTTHCLLFVDVAQGQSLSVLYTNMAGDYPGINHEVACRLARDAAGLMVQNLRAMAH